MKRLLSIHYDSENSPISGWMVDFGLFHFVYHPWAMKRLFIYLWDVLARKLGSNFQNHWLGNIVRVENLQTDVFYQKCLIFEVPVLFRPKV